MTRAVFEQQSLQRAVAGLFRNSGTNAPPLFCATDQQLVEHKEVKAAALRIDPIS